MAELTNTFATNRDTVAWAVEEATFGTEATPAASDAVRLIADPSVSQPRVYPDNPERIHSYSRTGRLAAGYEPGELSLSLFCKPAGSAGTKPQGAPLYKSLFGRETVTAGTSVVYQLLRLADTRPGLTVWIKKGHTLFRALGCVLTQGVFRIGAGNDAAGFAQVELSGLFRQLRLTGTGTVKTAVAEANKATAKMLALDDASPFDPGGQITIAGAGQHEIVAVNYGTGSLTLKDPVGVAVAVGAVVAPWTPSVTDTGAPVAGRLGTAQLGGATLPLLSGEITLNNNLEFLSGEKTASAFPERFAGGERTVELRSDIRWDATASRFYRQHRTDTKANLSLPAGSAAGQIVELAAQNVALNFPEVNDDTIRALSLTGGAYASASLDDELRLTFK